jgi:hypothetical protein
MDRSQMILQVSCLLIALLFNNCRSDESDIPGSNSSQSQGSGISSWDIPKNEVYDGGPGKDGIPALVNPDLIPASDADYLSDSDLILGYKNDNELIAYPHRILDWHEIINDKVNDHAFAIMYCPLTGTGIGWDRIISGEETTFGVSGLLYNNNLIPYDRKTDSNWSQMLLMCVNGELRGEQINTFPLVETTWATWKSMFPQTKVVSSMIGLHNKYDRYPYGDYKTNHNQIFFPYSPKNTKFNAKERVHGVIINGNAKAYPFKYFAQNISLIESEFLGIPIIVVGSIDRNFIVSFERKLEDGTLLTYKIADEQNQPVASPVILEDNEGNKWNIFGEAVSGPRKGQKLKSTTSYMGYWFAWGAFYPTVGIYKE